jgi:hypothetical protein
MYQSLSNGALDVGNAEPHQFARLRLARINAGSRLQRSAYVFQVAHCAPAIARDCIVAIRSASPSASKRLFTSYIARAISIVDIALLCIARNVQHYISISIATLSEHQRWALLMPTGGPRFQPRTSPDTHLTPKNTPLRFLNSSTKLSEPINRQLKLVEHAL